MTRIQLSDFQYVNRKNIKAGEALRFTLSLGIDLADGMVAELAIQGNMAFKRVRGDIYWTPPIARMPSGRTHQLHWINPTLYTIVLEALMQDGKKLLDRLKSPVKDLMAKSTGPRMAWEVDPTLPTVLEALKPPEAQ